MQWISQNEYLRNNVYTAVVGCHEPLPLSFEDYLSGLTETYYKSLSVPRPLPNSFGDRCRLEHNSYLANFNAELKLAEQECGHRVREAISRMPNITHVVFGEHAHTHYGPGSSCTRLSFETIMEAISASTIRLTSFTNICRISFRLKSQLSRNEDWSILTQRSLQNVETVCLHVWDNDQIRPLLSSFQGVKCLTLSSRRCLDDLGKYQFKHLEELCLRSAFLNKESFLQFLQAHQLRHLQISHSVLEGGIWRDVVEHIRSLQLTPGRGRQSIYLGEVYEDRSDVV